MYETPLTGLVLTGGGARAAYQVGVLAAIARLRRASGTDLRRNPFAVICGTSAGATSSAIPFVFPAADLDRDGQAEWFRDGSMRQMAPISPAIHLGAQRVLVIGAGRMHEPVGRVAWA